MRDFSAATRNEAGKYTSRNDTPYGRERGTIAFLTVGAINTDAAIAELNVLKLDIHLA